LNLLGSESSNSASKSIVFKAALSGVERGNLIGDPRAKEFGFCNNATREGVVTGVVGRDLVGVENTIGV
jgi:hypothetical protein